MNKIYLGNSNYSLSKGLNSSRVKKLIFFFSLWIRDEPGTSPTTHSTRLRIYPDTGATTYLGGLKHLQHIGLLERNLVPSRKNAHTVGGFSLVCQGWLPVTFKDGKRTTKQALYICKEVQVIYFSKAACIDVGILPPCFPKPMISPPSVTCNAVHQDI